MAKKANGASVDVPTYQCPVCETAIPLTPDQLVQSAAFCPKCNVHRETKDLKLA